jgi:hypothetical protein
MKLIIAWALIQVSLTGLAFGGGCSTDVDCMCTVEPERAWLLSEGVTEHEIQADQEIYDSDFCISYRAGKQTEAKRSTDNE